MKKILLKRLFFFVISLLFFQFSFAQKAKVTYDDDTIKVNGVPYASMKKKSAGFLMNDYSICNFSGTELIFIKSLTREPSRRTNPYGGVQAMEEYHEIHFISSGGKAELEHRTGKGFAKLIVDNNLIKDNAIDPEAERRFMQVYHGQYPSEPPPPSSNAPVVVNINNAPAAPADPPPPPLPKSKLPVTINGNEIVRDNNVIGKFRQDTTSSSYSEKQILIIVYSEAGDKVAEASAPIASPKEWSIKTFPEGKNFNIMYDSPGEREKMFRYLADKNYLIY